MRDGILVLYKPQNWTSSDCVAVCRRALGVKGIKKVGHGGTLDPMATGVLPIFVGQATRIMEYTDLDFKTYVCTARLGLLTDTLDIWGSVTGSQPWDEIRTSGTVTEETLRETIKSFEGEIQQIPPKYSAVRINGRRLYEYAYKGQEIEAEIKPRKVFIKKIHLIEADMNEGTFSFEAQCSKGTYIRTICSDIGDRLGCGCTMTALERTATGNITVQHAKVTAEQVKGMNADELEKLLLPPDYPLVHFGRAVMPPDRAEFFSRGNSIRIRQIKIEKKPSDETLIKAENARGRAYSRIYRIYEQGSEEFLGTGYYDDSTGEMKADKVLVKRR